MYDSDSRVILGLQVKKSPKAGIRIVLFEGAYVLSHWHVGLHKNEDGGTEKRAYIGVIKTSIPTRKLKRARRQRHQTSDPVESPIERDVVTTTLVKESAPIESFIDRRLCWKCNTCMQVKCDSLLMICCSGGEGGPIRHTSNFYLRPCFFPILYCSVVILVTEIRNSSICLHPTFLIST